LWILASSVLMVILLVLAGRAGVDILWPQDTLLGWPEWKRGIGGQRTDAAKSSSSSPGQGSAPNREQGMLVIPRTAGECVIIGDNILLTVVEIQGDEVRLSIEYPPEVPVVKGELFEAVRQAEAAVALPL
jgi:carbon storage regulator